MTLLDLPSRSVLLFPCDPLRRLPTSSRSTSAASSRRATESRRRTLVRIRLRGAAGNRLTCYDHFALDQIAFDNFSRRAVSQTNLDSTTLWRSVLAQHPNVSSLISKHVCSRRRELNITTVSEFRSRIRCAIAIRLPAPLSV